MDNDSYTTSPSSYAEDEDDGLHQPENEENRHGLRTATDFQSLRGTAAAHGDTNYHGASTQRLPPLPYVVPNPQRPRGPPPNMDWMESQDPPTLNPCQNNFTEAPTTLTHSVTECREYYLQQIDPIVGTFGEFNLPIIRSTFPAVETEENNTTDAPPEDAFEAEAATPPVVTPGTLPPEFYRQHVPDSALPLISPPFAKPPPPTSVEDNTIVHLYVKATISIQVGMPDVAGLMKIHDLLEFQMEKQATIIVLPSKRRGGAENPITTRWTTQKPPRHVYPQYFQGYTAQPTPKSAESSKKQKGTPSKPPTGAPPASKPTSHVLAVRCCVSLKQCHISTLEHWIYMTNSKRSVITLEIDSLRSEFLEHVGWITGSHVNMNRAHWEHFIRNQLTQRVGFSFPFQLHMAPLIPPKEATTAEKNRQQPKRNGDPIQMWRVTTGLNSAQGLTQCLHKLFHEIWGGKLFGQDMHYIPTSASVTPEGRRTLWNLGKTWQDSTVTVKSFGLRPIHTRIPIDKDKYSPLQSLAFLLRRLHHPAGGPIFRAVEEREHPSHADSLIHGNGPVVYLLVHREHKWMADKIAADVFTALAYTHKSLNRELVYRPGYVSVAKQQSIANRQAETALAALSLKVDGNSPTPKTGWGSGRNPGTWSKERGTHNGPNAPTSKVPSPGPDWTPAPGMGWGTSTPREHEVPPSDTSQTTPQERLTKKPRISPLTTSKGVNSVSDTTVSSLSHVEQLRITQLEQQMLHMHRTLATLFPELPHFTATGPTPDTVSPPAEMPRKKQPPSPAPSTSPNNDVEMSPTDAPNTDPAKQAEVEEIE